MHTNKYTYGKWLRKMKGLRKPDPNSKPFAPSEKMAEYISYLKERGLKCDKLQLASFQTKNGLCYPGLMAKEKIVSNEIFISLPASELLTTKKAFFDNEELTKVFESHPEFFSQAGSSSWEDHIIWAFLLKENERGRESRWYHLLQNLPREVDYLIFWEEKEIDWLEDRKLKTKALHTRAEFEKEYKQLSRILIDYVPSVFKNTSTFCYEDAKWIYIHLVSRCFGKYFAYTSMVPFAELLNHECSDVYYDFQYNEDNKFKKEEAEFPAPKELSEQDMEDNDSSEGSYHSKDSDSDEDFDWEDKKELSLCNWKTESDLDNKQESSLVKESSGNNLSCQHNDLQKKIRNILFKDGRVSFAEDKEDLDKDILANESINPIIRREIQLQSREIFLWAYNNLDYGDNISIFYSQCILSRTKQLEKIFMEKKMSYFSVKEELKRIETMNSRFKAEMIQFEKLLNGVADHYKMPTQKKKRRIPKKESREADLQEDNDFTKDSNKIYFQPREKWADDKFDRFVMKASSKDQFEQNSQVYFCYGRLSNRTSLMRYGMTLEYNKYDHLFIRVPYLHCISPGMVQKINTYNYNISKYKKFKLKRYVFNLDLLSFLRVQLFSHNLPITSIFYSTDLQTELAVLEAAIAIYQHFIVSHFSLSLQENEKLSTNKSIGYHEYFAVVYRLERQRMIDLQITLCKIAKGIISKMLEKNTEEYMDIYYEPIEGLEGGQYEIRVHRNLLDIYFERMKLDEMKQHKNVMIELQQKIAKNEQSELNRQKHAEQEEIERLAKKREQEQEIQKKIDRQREMLEKIKQDALKTTVTAYKYQPQVIQKEDPIKQANKKAQEDRLLKSFSIRSKHQSLSTTQGIAPSTTTPLSQTTTNSNTVAKFNPPKHIGFESSNTTKSISSNNNITSQNNNQYNLIQSLNPNMNLLRPLSIAELALKHSSSQQTRQEDSHSNQDYSPLEKQESLELKHYPSSTKAVSSSRKPSLPHNTTIQKPIISDSLKKQSQTLQKLNSLPQTKN